MSDSQPKTTKELQAHTTDDVDLSSLSPPIFVTTRESLEFSRSRMKSDVAGDLMRLIQEKGEAS